MQCSSETSPYFIYTRVGAYKAHSTCCTCKSEQNCCKKQPTTAAATSQKLWTPFSSTPHLYFRTTIAPPINIIRGACKNDSHFFLTLSFLVSDANDIDTKEEGEEKDEDALSFPIHL